jgi:hypothetical protein
MDSIFTRLTRRYDRYEPAIQREASRLIKGAIVIALSKIGNPTPEHIRIADALVWYLYDSDIDEVTRAFKGYHDEPAEDFCRSVWRITGAPENFEFFARCCMRVRVQLRNLIEVFVQIILGLTEDPNHHFATFLDSLSTEKP